MQRVAFCFNARGGASQHHVTMSIALAIVVCIFKPSLWHPLSINLCSYTMQFYGPLVHHSNFNIFLYENITGTYIFALIYIHKLLCIIYLLTNLKPCRSIQSYTWHSLCVLTRCNEKAKSWFDNPGSSPMYDHEYERQRCKNLVLHISRTPFPRNVVFPNDPNSVRTLIWAQMGPRA
jgi:hypothetical protein